MIWNTVLTDRREKGLTITHPSTTTKEKFTCNGLTTPSSCILPTLLTADWCTCRSGTCTTKTGIATHIWVGDGCQTRRQKQRRETCNVIPPQLYPSRSNFQVFYPSCMEQKLELFDKLLGVGQICGWSKWYYDVGNKSECNGFSGCSVQVWTCELLQLENNSAKKGKKIKALILGLGKRVRLCKQDIAKAKSLDSKKDHVPLMERSDLRKLQVEKQPGTLREICLLTAFGQKTKKQKTSESVE